MTIVTLVKIVTRYCDGNVLSRLRAAHPDDNRTSHSRNSSTILWWLGLWGGGVHANPPRKRFAHFAVRRSIHEDTLSITELARQKTGHREKQRTDFCHGKSSMVSQVSFPELITSLMTIDSCGIERWFSANWRQFTRCRQIWSSSWGCELGWV